MKILLLNGASRSGKDTCGQILKSQNPRFNTYKFSNPMDKAIPSLFGISSSRWQELRETLKDCPAPELMGRSPREVLISFAEDFLKPNYGADIFGKLAVQHIKTLVDTDMVIITDCGFIEEINPLIDAFGKDSITLIHIYRQDCDFANDSRGHLVAPKGIKEVHIFNNSTLHDLEFELYHLIPNFTSMDF